MMKRILTLLAVAAALSGCSTQPVTDQYLNQAPAMDLNRFFEGEVKAWGIVQNRSGHLVQRFQVDIIGTVDNRQLTLHETFTYGLGDGPTTRIWEISDEGNGSYSGSASDIADPATGRSFGNAFNWSYEMDLPVGDTEYRVRFDDWMYLQPDGVLLNKARVYRWGVCIGTVFLSFSKDLGQSSQSKSASALKGLHLAVNNE